MRDSRWTFECKHQQSKIPLIRTVHALKVLVPGGRVTRANEIDWWFTAIKINSTVCISLLTQFDIMLYTKIERKPKIRKWLKFREMKPICLRLEPSGNREHESLWHLCYSLDALLIKSIHMTVVSKCIVLPLKRVLSSVNFFWRIQPYALWIRQNEEKIFYSTKPKTIRKGCTWPHWLSIHTFYNFAVLQTTNHFFLRFIQFNRINKFEQYL